MTTGNFGFPDLADLYDPLTMPVEYIPNDKAVMAAYGFGIKMTECVAELMKLYQKMQDALNETRSQNALCNKSGQML